MSNLQISRRQLLAGCGAGLLVAAGAGFAQAAAQPLPILPLQDLSLPKSGRIPLSLQSGRHSFGGQTMSQTFGINSSNLGPVLRAKKGQTLPFDITNTLKEATTLHWHGLHIPGDVDGGPHQEILPDQIWQPDVPIAQRASMNWFHAHTHGRTARQTYLGLAGVMLIEDDDSLNADLPKSYGIDDLTVILQDKSFDAAGQLQYDLTGEVFEEGFLGETLVVNGVAAPTVRQVPRGWVRVRLLNACNARFLTVSMATGPVVVIASDGGFLAAPVEVPEIVMSPGERYEILLDMRTMPSNGLNVAMGIAEDEGVLENFFGRLFGGGVPVVQTALTFVPDPTLPAFTGALPRTLAQLDPPDPSLAVKTRSFTLNMEGGEDLATLAANWGNLCGTAAGMGINGQPMKMDAINEEVRLGDYEIWRVRADQDLHPFHVHGCSFRILKQNGSAPPQYASGWKDMVHVQGGWSEILVKFDHPASREAPFMYHCHILEHEDCGMMGQFTVTVD